MSLRYEPPFGQPESGPDPLPAPAYLFNLAPCALLLTDPDGMILQANVASVNWLGYPHHELTGGMRLQDLLSIGAGVLYQSHCQPMLQLQQAVSDVQIDLVRRDGARVPAVLAIARHRFDTGTFDEVAIQPSGDRRAFERELQRLRAEALAAQAARDDLTEKLRTAIGALAAAERHEDAFLEAFCHDLRNPLAPMRNGLELLKITLPADHAAASVVAMLDRQLDRLVQMIDDAAGAEGRRGDRSSEQRGGPPGR
ncbi:histidine kinase dimerization/phospho-acceptor domain-containing protein [Pseudoduganella lutea]|uniref:histidine kinase n=1 Tax=Pseudoduganella lutea TaxID=321985 RepID=A0A4P6L3E7_9BURK|nr:histidine kinase dimerization/phospho-acceptor domain-containing protein [Pseudoduganella lutea]QBE65989.1 hypothetical protein EWM63_25865 [Pseudoduganella lutea]